MSLKSMVGGKALDIIKAVEEKNNDEGSENVIMSRLSTRFWSDLHRKKVPFEKPGRKERCLWLKLSREA